MLLGRRELLEQKTNFEEQSGTQLELDLNEPNDYLINVDVPLEQELERLLYPY